MPATEAMNRYSMSMMPKLDMAGSAFRSDSMIARSDFQLRAILKTRARRKQRRAVSPLIRMAISRKLTATMTKSKVLNGSLK